ncbi:hypothetical protein QUF72_01715 [Desulfobacterales bacterium HSG2]|nr:hypothetical protein [Desulfobacterales bacterium HSG2]
MPPKNSTINDLLEVPWRGLRADAVIHPGPIDPDGQRSYILEDPVRGNNFRLGYAEGELLYRLITEPDPDAALADLYATSTLRPSPEEAAAFITMLQKEGLAILPAEEIIRRETSEEVVKHSEDGIPLHRKLLQIPVFFRVPLLRPDDFLTRTFPYLSWLWSPSLCAIYGMCGLLGLILTIQEIELYLSTVSYLFTPQGGLAFFLCLTLLKTGHEFAHAYAVKALSPELHVRSMGIFFIVFWPLLYTDTTDVWKIPDRRRRMWVSAAGVLFELAVAGIALLLWAMLPDGILRSLMFFLSGTSLFTSVFVNLNPFMRFDGYYLLMDFWGIDNLRPRSIAMLRHTIRRALFDWKGPVPEIHPHRRGMIFYGFLAILYRIFIALSIAAAVYYLLFPVLGLLVLTVELWLFIIRPLWIEIVSLFKNREHIGSKLRVSLTACGFLALCLLLCAPLPRFRHLPCMLLLKGTTRIESPGAGQIASALPQVGHIVKAGDLITRIEDDSLLYEIQNARFDLESVRVSIENIGTGGERGSYRNWLMAEEKRLTAALEKLNQASAQLEIRAPAEGRITDINEALYEGAFVEEGTWLFTIANPDERELKVFVHETLKVESHSLTASKFRPLTVSHTLSSPGYPARFREKSDFPMHYLPNESLLDFAGGPIISVQDTRGRRPRDAHFAFYFDVQDAPAWLPHGMPAWIWIRSETQSVMGQLFSRIWKSLTERGF